MQDAYNIVLQKPPYWGGWWGYYGRMYDPVLRQMLSPDPVLQDPSNTQNYNKYAYVFNNPLKYTDPSGFVGTPMASGESMQQWSVRTISDSYGNGLAGDAFGGGGSGYGDEGGYKVDGMPASARQMMLMTTKLEIQKDAQGNEHLVRVSNGLIESMSIVGDCSEYGLEPGMGYSPTTGQIYDPRTTIEINNHHRKGDVIINGKYYTKEEVEVAHIENVNVINSGTNAGAAEGNSVIEKYIYYCSSSNSNDLRGGSYLLATVTNPNAQGSGGVLNDISNLTQQYTSPSADLFIGATESKIGQILLDRGKYGSLHPETIIRTPVANISLSTKLLQNTGTALKWGGRAFGAVGLVGTYAQWQTGAIGNTEAALDATFGAIGFLPGYGWAVSGAYFLIAKPLYNYSTKP